MYDIIELPSKNYRSNQNHPICVIAHCIGLPLEEAISLLLRPTLIDHQVVEVSAHYFIPQISAKELQKEVPQLFENQKFEYPDQVPVIQLVAEEDIAFHAGKSYWNDFNLKTKCTHSLNPCSIGIEFHAPGYAYQHFIPYTEEQIQTGLKLVQRIFKKWDIPKYNFFGHSDIAPNRKTDPGPYFPWEAFHAKKIGFQLPRLLPACEQSFSSEEEKIFRIQSELVRIGYFCPQNGIFDIFTQNAVHAFQMHFLRHTWNNFQSEINKLFLSALAETPSLS